MTYKDDLLAPVVNEEEFWGGDVPEEELDEEEQEDEEEPTEDDEKPIEDETFEE